MGIAAHSAQGRGIDQAHVTLHERDAAVGPGDEELFVATERSMAVAVGRRLADFLPFGEVLPMTLAVADCVHLLSTVGSRVAARARPHLERLRGTFGETVNLGLLDGTRVAYLVILESPKSMRFAARPGDSPPTAQGLETHHRSWLTLDRRTQEDHEDHTEQRT